jgi:hypothetical protein
MGKVEQFEYFRNLDCTQMAYQQTKSTPWHGYREGDFGAVKELLSYSSSQKC